MNKEFLIKYEELLNKGYCDCNEMNCIDNNSPRRILNIAKQLQQENKILKENAEHNDKVVDKVNWENMLLKKENKQLKDELKSKPDAQITLQDDKGNKFMVIQTERIDMQVELNKTIEKLFNNWNKLKECLKDVMNSSEADDKEFVETILDIIQEIEQGSDSNENN